MAVYRKHDAKTSADDPTGVIKLSVSPYWPTIETETGIYKALLELGYTKEKIFFMHPGERERIAREGVRAAEKGGR